MMLLIEHDTILPTPEARQNLAAVVANHPRVNIAVFHSATLPAAEVYEAYPAMLRQRMLLTPSTPREHDRRFWISYEAGCVWAALRHNGTLAQCEAVMCVVPPAWGDSARELFGAKQVLVIDKPFSVADARRLSCTLSHYRAPAHNQVDSVAVKGGASCALAAAPYPSDRPVIGRSDRSIGFSSSAASDPSRRSTTRQPVKTFHGGTRSESISDSS